MAGRWQGADEARLTSLKMIHTGESVWMDSLMASSGPKDGSTSPSATPLEKEPGGESTGVTWGRSPGIQDPPPQTPRGPRAAMAAPCPQLPDTRWAEKSAAWTSIQCKMLHLGEQKKSAKQNKMGSIWLRITAVKDTSVQDHGMEASLISIVLARSQPVAMSHFWV